MREHRQITDITSVFTQVMLVIIVFMFIDDADLPTLAGPAEMAEELLATAETKVRIWQKGLKIKGGDNKPSRAIKI